MFLLTSSLGKICPLRPLASFLRLWISFLFPRTRPAPPVSGLHYPCASFDTRTFGSFLSSALPALCLLVLSLASLGRNVRCIPIGRQCVGGLTVYVRSWYRVVRYAWYRREGVSVHIGLLLELRGGQVGRTDWRVWFRLYCLRHEESDSKRTGCLWKTLQKSEKGSTVCRGRVERARRTVFGDGGELQRDGVAEIFYFLCAG